MPPFILTSGRWLYSAFATILNAIGLIVNGAVILLASKVGSKLASNANIAKRLNQLFASCDLD